MDRGRSCVDAMEDEQHSEYDDEWTVEDSEDLSSVAGGGSRRLWNSDEVFPAGVQNWRDSCNCTAALRYECPCGEMCLSKVGGIISLYEHRRLLRVAIRQRGGGGMREEIKAALAARYDAASGTFARAFVVGENGRVCERAFAVACSVSEATFVRARADVTKGRVHTGKRKERLSHDRRELDAWVRLQCETMEADKIEGTKRFTEKTSEKQLWKRYVASCDHAKQPTVGTSRLLHTIWKEHTEIKERGPTGHAICSTCGMLASLRSSLEGLDDVSSANKRKALDEEERAHHSFHTTERRKYDLAVARATHVPNDITTITIDAPTQHQFDLPSQARAKRDTVKKLDGTSRWQSKLEGVLDAGAPPQTLHRPF